MLKIPQPSAATAHKRATPLSHAHAAVPGALAVASLFAALACQASCTAEPKSGVYSCALNTDCPGHQECDPDQRLCFDRSRDDSQRTDDASGMMGDGAASAGTITNPSGAAADGGRGGGGMGAQRSGAAASGGTAGRGGNSTPSNDPAAHGGGRSGSPGSNADPGSGNDDQSANSGSAADGSSQSNSSHAAGSGNPSGSHGPAAGSGQPPGSSNPSHDAGSGGDDAPRAGAAAPPSRDAGRSAADGGAGASSPAEAGRGPERAGMSAPPPAGSSAPTPPPCPTGGFCYGFERGVLDPTGELWPSPVENGRVPSQGQLTTLELPASTGNHVLVSTPNAIDEWPKATVGMTRHDAYSKLTVELDFAHSTSLRQPTSPVVILRVITTQDPNGNSVDFLIENDGALWLDVRHVDTKYARTDRVVALGEPTRLTRVRLVLTRGSSCSAIITYGDGSKTVPMHCDLSDYQIELGLNVLKPSDQPYRADYSASYDNLTVSSQ